MSETVLTYRAPSAATTDALGTNVLLVSESAAPALMVDNFLTHPAQAAAALLLVASVARSRFYLPPSMVAAIVAAADPVVTANTDRLRFESFSACCGVAARYDVLPGGMDGAPLRTGTTNVDLNSPVREALAEVRSEGPLHLKVGTDVTVTTMRTSIVERKVPLPTRWVRGFAEAQAASVGLVRRFELSTAEARRFLRNLPASSNGRSMLYVVRARDGLRLTSSAAAGAVPLGGPARLRVLEPMLAYADRLSVYGPATPGPGVSLWQLDLPDGRFSLTLSAAAMRGFSGEGGLLFDLADPHAVDDALLLTALLSYDPVLDVDRLARDSGLDRRRVLVALAQLAAAGRVGYDAAEGAYFTRELPWDRELLESMHPRLADARRLVAAGALQPKGAVTEVSSGSSVHLVRQTTDGFGCTCPWYAQNGTNRGPCKHALAVHLTAARR
ncbi:SWIM zinc finger family protein [uncultured Friedmanniella sp.]|uniref:SWIM zinc finger family protein n=1 Tax=uncultured Friedmanniella sp. TaxID=335381 RepID=UPI0035CB671E